jgi:hypothetical protein
MEILSAYISVRVTNTAVGSINPHLPLFVAWNQWPVSSAKISKYI